MPINEVTIVRLCAVCRGELGTLTVKKDNMRLMTSELTWCEPCGQDCPEIRDVFERGETIASEQASYPGNYALENISASEFRRRRSARV